MDILCFCSTGSEGKGCGARKRWVWYWRCEGMMWGAWVSCQSWEEKTGRSGPDVGHDWEGRRCTGPVLIPGSACSCLLFLTELLHLPVNAVLVLDTILSVAWVVNTMLDAWRNQGLPRGTWSYKHFFVRQVVSSWFEWFITSCFEGFEPQGCSKWLNQVTVLRSCRFGNSSLMLMLCDCEYMHAGTRRPYGTSSFDA